MEMQPDPGHALNVQAYIDASGFNRFGDFFDRLTAPAAAKVAGVVEKLIDGYTGGLKSVGGGVAEWRLHWGPGIRLYLHQDGQTLILLLGGTYGKATQSADIRKAQALVVEYKRRKRCLLPGPGS